MTNSWNRFFNLAIKSSLLLALPISAFASPKITLTTESYPPFNMKNPQNSQDALTGESTEIMQELFQRTHTDYTMKVLPWPRAYNLALQKDNTAVFSTTMTEDRKDQFKWVGPIAENDWVFFAKKGSKIVINSLEDAKKYNIGGYYRDATTEYLKTQGIYVHEAPRDRINAKLINAKRIDLWVTGEKSGQWIAKQEGVEVEKVFSIKHVEMYAAFHKSMDDSKINALNQSLENMKKDGTFAKIVEKYN